MSSNLQGLYKIHFLNILYEFGPNIQNQYFNKPTLEFITFYLAE